VAEHKQKPLGDRVFDLRTEAGWTQRQLAKEAGLSHPTVVKIETGQMPQPRLSTLRKLGKAFGDMTPRELVEGPKGQPVRSRVNGSKSGRDTVTLR
jgi:transcriptional regulator with XRE-family HTH domain